MNPIPSPGGSDGLIAEVITPPWFVGVAGLIVEFLANDRKLGV